MERYKFFSAVTDKINKKLQELIKRYNNSEGKEREDLWKLLGELEDASYDEDGTLKLYFVSKAYGNGRRSEGTLNLLNDAQYKSKGPQLKYNPFKDEDYWTNPSLEYIANSVARFVNKCGGKVKRITYIEERD